MHILRGYLFRILHVSVVVCNSIHRARCASSELIRAVGEETYWFVVWYPEVVNLRLFL